MNQKLSESPEGRLSQIRELLWEHLIDTRDAAILLGTRPEDAPPGGIYVDRTPDESDDWVDE